jgi:hypothetical protein
MIGPDGGVRFGSLTLAGMQTQIMRHGRALHMPRGVPTLRWDPYTIAQVWATAVKTMALATVKPSICHSATEPSVLRQSRSSTPSLF